MFSSKILGVLVFTGTGRRPGQPTQELSYRLPHNEYRDYLLADGLFRLIQGESPPCGDDDTATAGELARAYHRSRRVSDFLAEMARQAAENPELEFRLERFATRVVVLMNKRLRNEDPAERSDCSPHGAMLSLLLSELLVENLPSRPVLNTQGVNFHGAAAYARGNERVMLPGSKNWSGAVLREADFRGADFSGCNLENANLDNTRLNGADLSGAYLARANMRNVAMGRFKNLELPTVLTGARFDDGKDALSGADWFNYRLQGLKGYFCFWDLELLEPGRGALVAGSRGQLLFFDLASPNWTPVYLQTQHEDDILDLSSQAGSGLIVTTSRDGSVRVHKLPSGPPSGIGPFTEARRVSMSA